jgi:hypothetical protein
MLAYCVAALIIVFRKCCSWLRRQNNERKRIEGGNERMARRLWAKQHLANRQLAKQLNKGIMYQSTANQNLFSQHFIFFVTYEWAL